MGRLIWGFAVRTFNIVGNLMSRLNYIYFCFSNRRIWTRLSNEMEFWDVEWARLSRFWQDEYDSPRLVDRIFVHHIWASSWYFGTNRICHKPLLNAYIKFSEYILNTSCSPRGDTLNFSSYLGSGPASTAHPKRNFKHPQKIFEILATQKISPFCTLTLKKYPKMHRNDP